MIDARVEAHRKGDAALKTVFQICSFYNSFGHKLSCLLMAVFDELDGANHAQRCALHSVGDVCASAAPSLHAHGWWCMRSRGRRLSTTSVDGHRAWLQRPALPPQRLDDRQAGGGHAQRHLHALACTHLPGRFHPQFRDESRRYIGKSQSIWTKMETPGSRACARMPPAPEVARAQRCRCGPGTPVCRH
jgi:hypothetical protein